MNLRGLSDYKKQDKNKDKDGKKPTSSYTGGQSSGMAVINPDVKGLMDKAEKNSKSQDEYVKEEKSKNASVCRITLYKNGYCIDQGEFMNYSNPKNKEFMKKLNEGYIPKQLREKYPTGELSVSLNDKTEEDYVPPPPPAYVEFSGAGVSFGEPKKETKFAKKSKACENFVLQPNKNKQVTTVRVRLMDGKTITVQVNLDTIIQDVYNHIATVSGVSTFELFGGFPPKPLTMKSTIEQNDLAGGTLIQK